MCKSIYRSSYHLKDSTPARKPISTVAQTLSRFSKPQDTTISSTNTPHQVQWQPVPNKDGILSTRPAAHAAEEPPYQAS
ncbi:hypothetical protein [Neisseria maigaei]|uniref:hypothetical protein n=1 Tax=Neisseria maigaei TaxID=2830651 RepID=UPI0026591826|nr:hypothetical protein [Neisseria maigaei]